MGDLQKATLTHVFAMRRVLRPDQAATFDRLFATLSEDGGVLMPPGNYGRSRNFAWINDRFGVSWQLNLA